uniref:Uncharacterized protein n=1 Tax=Arundo donax TaxID=35708 RepID=A0A0A8XTJ1_ARUDO
MPTRCCKSCHYIIYGEKSLEDVKIHSLIGASSNWMTSPNSCSANHTSLYLHHKHNITPNFSQARTP